MNGKSLVFVLLGLAAAASILYLTGVFSPGGPPTPTGAVGASTGEDPGGATEDARASGGEVPRGADVSRAVSEEVGTRSPGSVPGDEDGWITVSGRLVDLEGAPIAGARVSLTQRRGTSPTTLREPGDAAPHRNEMECGPDGGFSLRALANRRGVLAIDDAGGWLLEQDAEDFEGAAVDVDLGDLRAERAAMISGIVVDRRGAPLEGVVVRTGGGGWGLLGRGENRTTTAADGSFEVSRVRAGEVALRTESPKHLPGLLELEVREGERRTGLEIVVDEGRSIAGQVFDDLGRPIEGARVGAQRSVNSPGVQVMSFREGETATTDANGFFVLGGLDGEVVYLRAWSQGHGGAGKPDVSLGSQNVVFELPRHAVVTGVLRDVAGAPIAGSEVTAVTASGRAPHFGAIEPTPRATTAADGSFRLERIVPGTVSLVAQGDHREARLEGVQTRPGEELSGQVLVARAGAAVDITVVDHEGNPVRGAEVRVALPRPSEDGSVVVRSVRARGAGPAFIEDSEALGSETTDASGRARVGGLEADVVEVSASHDAFASAVPATVKLPSAGSVEVELAMRQAGSALVRCVDATGQPVPECRVRFEGPEGSSPHEADAAGMLLVDGLVPGTYDAVITLPPRPLRMGGAVMVIGDQSGRAIDQTRTPFTVVAGEVTEFALTKPVLTRVTGRVQGPEGGVAGVTVELEAVREGDGEGAAMAMAMAGMTSGPSDQTDALGRFEIDDVTPGRYAVRWGRSGQIVKDRKEIDVQAGQALVELDLPMRGGTVQLTVRDDEGAPLANAKVRVVRGGAEQEGRSTRMIMFSAVTVDGSGSGPGSMTSMTLGDDSVTTDAEGVATIEGVPPGEYRLSVSHTGYADGRSEPVTVVDRGLADAGVLRLEAAAMVGGKILGLVPGPGGLVMARVEYRKADATGWSSSTSRGDRFHLDSLTPGAWVFRASALAPGSEPGPEVQVELSRGSNPDLELSLE